MVTWFGDWLNIDPGTYDLHELRVIGAIVLTPFADGLVFASESELRRGLLRRISSLSKQAKFKIPSRESFFRLFPKRAFVILTKSKPALFSESLTLDSKVSHLTPQSLPSHSHRTDWRIVSAK